MSTRTSIYKTPEGEKQVMALYDSLLNRWPVPHDELNIPTRYGSTFVIASGQPSAPSLVLLHGAGTNSSIWGADVAGYSRYYRVYAVDLLGEAGKSDPNRPDWNSPAFAEWLDEVLQGLKVEKAVLVGISQGGWTALKYATWKPEKIEKLALICPGGVVPDRLSFIFPALLFSLAGKWGARKMIRLLYADQPVPEGVEEISAVMMRNFKARVGVLPVFSDEELRRLVMPILLLGGTKDALRDIEKIAARLQNLAPQVKVEIIPGAGHVVLNTVDRIVSFLSPQDAVVKGS